MSNYHNTNRIMNQVQNDDNTPDRDDPILEAINQSLNDYENGTNTMVDDDEASDKEVEGFLGQVFSVYMMFFYSYELIPDQPMAIPASDMLKAYHKSGGMDNAMIGIKCLSFLIKHDALVDIEGYGLAPNLDPTFNHTPGITELIDAAQALKTSDHWQYKMARAKLAWDNSVDGSMQRQVVPVDKRPYIPNYMEPREVDMSIDPMHKEQEEAKKNNSNSSETMEAASAAFKHIQCTMPYLYMIYLCQNTKPNPIKLTGTMINIVVQENEATDEDKYVVLNHLRTFCRTGFLHLQFNPDDVNEDDPIITISKQKCSIPALAHKIMATILEMESTPFLNKEIQSKLQSINEIQEKITKHIKEDTAQADVEIAEIEDSKVELHNVKSLFNKLMKDSSSNNLHN